MGFTLIYTLPYPLTHYLDLGSTLIRRIHMHAPLFLTGVPLTQSQFQLIRCSALSLDGLQSGHYRAPRIKAAYQNRTSYYFIHLQNHCSSFSWPMCPCVPFQDKVAYDI